MPRLFAIATCFFWMTFYVLSAMSILGVGQGAMMVPFVPADAGLALGRFGTFGFAVATGAVAAGFLWAFAALLLEDDAERDESGTVLQVAYAGAILLAASSLLVFAGISAGALVQAAVLQIAALSACLFAAEAEKARLAARQARTENQVIQRMALDAAHYSVLPHLGGRGQPGERPS
ncbi:hypothetical protein CSC94_05485 [Zhengella mangrovi]|uniref:Uncharacterized protein n=1 Tax=Zhengella mangrovi TaxID=1982044 RepID=A0A2G1QRK0_9HYPH|nr:hypothetical protein [Zhengella mangrovi]PHP68111.1 hypothetical protein CSC94_05485 [Zhengella mangrovi]